MLPLAVESGAGLCAMHMQGTPQTMQDQPQYTDVVAEIHDYLRRRRDVLLAAGVAPERICLDPGIGFGKTHEHNLELMRHCERFQDLGCPILVGHSRKGFLGKLLGDSTANRDAATLGSALSLAQQGVQVLRVHEVRYLREALLAFVACGGMGWLGSARSAAPSRSEGQLRHCWGRLTCRPQPPPNPYSALLQNGQPAILTGLNILPPIAL